MEKEFIVRINGSNAFRTRGKDNEVIDFCKKAAKSKDYLQIFKLSGPGLHNSVCIFSEFI